MGEPRIRVLDDEVAARIAAGEVVERPASVVKELVENAIDAGATRITVEVVDGGRRRIRVADNGCGMTAQETVLALQRHATSKISGLEDLGRVRTLGFRGEALPSIASVSRLSILSRPWSDLEGVRLTSEGGEILAVEPAAAAEGTVIDVEDLFFNTPVRLRFLKSTRSEIGQVCEVVCRLAGSHPEIAFRLLSDGTEVLSAPATADPVNTVAAVWGADVARELTAVSSARPGLSVEGFVSRPPYARPSRSGQHCFVNGRWVRSRTVTHAVDEAFRGVLPAGRHPFAVLHLDMDPELVDVNVHPAKTEVRFLRDWEVHRTVLEAIRRALAASSQATGAPPLSRRATLSAGELESGSWLPGSGGAPARAGAAAATAIAPPVAVQAGLPGIEAPTPGPRVIAQLWKSYILAESQSGLVLIDQHLAHERVLFQRLREEAGGGRREIAPVTLQVTHREALVIDAATGLLAEVGFELEAFGRDAFVLRAAPIAVPPGREAEIANALFDELVRGQDSGTTGVASMPVLLAAATACRTAVKKGTVLERAEMEQLLSQLEGVEHPDVCPHGCPVRVEIRLEELLRRFRRN